MCCFCNGYKADMLWFIKAPLGLSVSATVAAQTSPFGDNMDMRAVQSQYRHGVHRSENLLAQYESTSTHKLDR